MKEKISNFLTSEDIIKKGELYEWTYKETLIERERYGRRGEDDPDKVPISYKDWELTVAACLEPK